MLRITPGTHRTRRCRLSPSLHSQILHTNICTGSSSLHVLFLLQGKTVQPPSATIRLIQDKFVQKQHFAAQGVPLPDFLDCADDAQVGF